jgi:hypothetical protein
LHTNFYKTYRWFLEIHHSSQFQPSWRVWGFLKKLRSALQIQLLFDFLIAFRHSSVLPKCCTTDFTKITDYSGAQDTSFKQVSVIINDSRICKKFQKSFSDSATVYRPL